MNSSNYTEIRGCRYTMTEDGDNAGANVSACTIWDEDGKYARVICDGGNVIIYTEEIPAGAVRIRSEVYRDLLDGLARFLGCSRKEAQHLIDGSVLREVAA